MQASIALASCVLPALQQKCSHVRTRVVSCAKLATTLKLHEGGKVSVFLCVPKYESCSSPPVSHRT
ncbi:hypothetical protein PR003_g8398 [Phytophthora rubi]|uniref:Uncharacterized protein n=1 Tax=Phytophthora rubi TaxID=129364 RepID=A0A6A4FJ04_9STRA|nr:hypothetical protein PR003_g8398 [Phytophthora rubi]